MENACFIRIDHPLIDLLSHALCSLQAIQDLLLARQTFRDKHRESIQKRMLDAVQSFVVVASGARGQDRFVTPCWVLASWRCVTCWQAQAGGSPDTSSDLLFNVMGVCGHKFYNGVWPRMTPPQMSSFTLTVSLVVREVSSFTRCSSWRTPQVSRPRLLLGKLTAPAYCSEGWVGAPDWRAATV